MSEDTQKEKPQDGLALIIGGLFILALIFAAYNYFKSGKDGSLTDTSDSTAVETQLKEEQGDLNGDGAQDKNDKEAETTPGKIGTVTNDNTNKTETSSATWTATDYKQGEIKGTSYTVKSGDTLWEIAEGAYGDGSMWTKILGANQANVDFLANGQQALIVPGQTLILP